ncbi:SagB-type dehydrogenase domain-containing protein [Fibrobacter sp. UWOV1]|uniref:nitroreductase family protein n=1 Tax=Fibrobacter sp. UWOV1 TaxID=1896215 RepID=UPI000913FE95|nr:nitroreductase family protein [Fibrobacter sp. UWOV1]SHK85037.1 SagB-type dehydrogenase domain-containing protein [Fibrobacter sp. UWOV1]
MRFFSEKYHESICLVRKEKPVDVCWESQKNPDRRYKGCNRIDLHQGEIPAFGYVSGDNLKPVGVYVVVRGRKVPDGVYAYDAVGKSKVPDVVGQLVRVGGREEMKKIVAAFPDKDFAEEAPLIYIFTGLLERSVWHYREAAYAQVMQDVGACAASVMLHSKSKGAKVFALGGFVDDEIAVTLNLPVTEIPLAALAVFPEYSELAFDSVDEGVGETAYSNRSEMETEIGYDPARYPALFMRQNRAENITDLTKCIRIRRLSAQAYPGEEFPLTPAKYDAASYLGKLEDIEMSSRNQHPFRKVGFDLDDFSSMLRWLEVGQINLFGAGLLKIWVISFDVMFVYPGVYRYVPVRKSVFMQSAILNIKKFAKCHAVPEVAENTAFALLLTADLNESCNLLGERAYRYMNLNAGYIAQSMNLSGQMLRKATRCERFFYHDELKKLCEIPEGESIVAEILVGKA